MENSLAPGNMQLGSVTEVACGDDIIAGSSVTQGPLDINLQTAESPKVFEQCCLGDTVKHYHIPITSLIMAWTNILIKPNRILAAKNCDQHAYNTHIIIILYNIWYVVNTMPPLLLLSVDLEEDQSHALLYSQHFELCYPLNKLNAKIEVDQVS